MKLEKIVNVKKFPSGSAGALDVVSAYLEQFGNEDPPATRGNPLDIRDHDLTTLLGCPTRVYGDFLCSCNNLVNLEHAPALCDGDFLCSINKLTSLHGLPRSINGRLYVNNNNLTNLDGCSDTVHADFFCGNNKLTSLTNCPRTVGGLFHCVNNELTALENFHTSVGDDFTCSGNKIKTLHNVHKMFGSIKGMFIANECPITSHVLGLILIPDLKRVVLDAEEVADIVNRHLGTGRVGLIACQRELTAAGYKDFAQI